MSSQFGDIAALRVSVLESAEVAPQLFKQGAQFVRHDGYNSPLGLGEALQRLDDDGLGSPTLTDLLTPLNFEAPPGSMIAVRYATS